MFLEDSPCCAVPHLAELEQHVEIHRILIPAATTPPVRPPWGDPHNIRWTASKGSRGAQSEVIRAS